MCRAYRAYIQGIPADQSNSPHVSCSGCHRPSVTCSCIVQLLLRSAGGFVRFGEQSQVTYQQLQLQCHLRLTLRFGSQSQKLSARHGTDSDYQRCTASGQQLSWNTSERKHSIHLYPTWAVHQPRLRRVWTLQPLQVVLIAFV